MQFTFGCEIDKALKLPYLPIGDEKKVAITTEIINSYYFVTFCCGKIQEVKIGGWFYSHTVRNVIEKRLRRKNVSYCHPGLRPIVIILSYTLIDLFSVSYYLSPIV